jgi:hypothetical protein
VIGRQNLFFLCFGIADFGIEDTAPATLFATILLLALRIVSILDDVLAVAMWATVSDELANHVIKFNTSFEF